MMTESERFNAIIAALPVALEVHRDWIRYSKEENTLEVVGILSPISLNDIIDTATTLVELAELSVLRRKG